MKKQPLYFILLFALLFNITHASIIAIEDDCHEKSSIHTYVLEQSQSVECGDLCDMYHLFHFMAIIESLESRQYLAFASLLPTHQASMYSSAFIKTSSKPPIV